MPREKQLYIVIFVLAIAFTSVSSYLLAFIQHSHQSLPTTMIVTNQETQLKTITVTGSGKAMAKPNLVRMRLGVSTQESTATEALAKNAELMSEVIKTLKAMGILEENIETYRFCLYPRYYRGSLIGFGASHILQVTTNSSDKIGQIVDKAVEAGANRIEMIFFTFTKEKISELDTLARRRAIEDAKEKAETIANSLGVKIVGVAKVEEIYYRPYRPRYPELYVGEIKTVTPIMPPAEGEIVVTVKVTFIIE